MIPQTLETLSRLEATGFNRAQSEAIIFAVGQADSELATKTDLQFGLTELRSEIGQIKADLKVSTATLEAKISSSEAKMWRLAITVASLAVLLNKFLDWVIR